MENNGDSEDKETPGNETRKPSSINPEEQEELNKKLHAACNWSNDKVDLEEVERLLTAGADINSQDRYGMTCLIHTAREGRLETTKLLIENKASVNIKDKYGETALHYVSLRRHREIVKLLLQSGADPNIKDKNGESTLFLASEKGYIEIVDLLLEYGATDDREQIKLSKKLHAACDYGNDEVDLEEVERLLTAGADVNSKDRYGYGYGDTCLMKTASKGRLEATKLLIENKASLNIKNDRTALHFASFEGRHEVVKLLLQSGADPYIKDSRNVTALALAQKNDNKEIQKIFLDHILASKTDNGMKTSSDIISFFLEKDLRAIDNLFMFIREYMKMNYDDENKKKFLNVFINKDNPFFLIETEKLAFTKKDKKESLLSYLINKGCVRK